MTISERKEQINHVREENRRLMDKTISKTGHGSQERTSIDSRGGKRNIREMVDELTYELTNN
jgi:hypothetical protein